MSSSEINQVLANSLSPGELSIALLLGHLPLLRRAVLQKYPHNLHSIVPLSPLSLSTSLARLAALPS